LESKTNFTLDSRHTLGSQCILNGKLGDIITMDSQLINSVSDLGNLHLSGYLS
ncbi:hypothetical protein Bpfe_020896, partial [Biomphalaria pfeifferi]